MSNQIRSVVVVGAGTMGQEIAAKCLISGIDTRLYDVRDVKTISANLIERLTANIADEFSQQRQRKLLSEFRITTDAAAAASGVDLLIEAVPEDIALKRKVLHQFGKLCPEAIFTTNTSSFVASQMRRVTPAEDRFAVLHFTFFKPVEIMGHDRTSQETVEQLRQFVEAIDHVPIVCRQEIRGAILNSMLSPLLGAAVSISAQGLASTEEIDFVWEQVSESNRGPLAILDGIGLDTALMVTQAVSGLADEVEIQRRIQHLQDYVDKGWLGVKTNRGFYHYRNNDPTTRSTSPVPATPAGEPSEWSILSAARQIESGRIALNAVLDPAREGFLADHVFKKTPLLPAAAVVELFRRSVEVVTTELPVGILDLKFVNGLRCNRSAPQNVTIELNRVGDTIDCELKHEFCNRAGQVLDPNRLCATGRLIGGLDAHLGQSRPISEFSGDWKQVSYRTTADTFLGPSMQCLKQIALSLNSAIGQIECVVPDTRREAVDADRHRMIAFIDAAFVACTVYTQEQLGDAIQLPVEVKQLRIARSPVARESCQVHLQCVELSDISSEFNLQVVADGQVIMDVIGYQCRVMRNQLPVIRLS